MSVRWCAALLLSFLIIGCSKKEPETLPDGVSVKGTVTKNNNPLKGGMIQFRNESDSNIVVNSLVDDFGKFELQTQSANKKQKGAPKGTYKIMYLPPGTDQQGVNPIEALKEYKIDGPQDDLKVELFAK